MEESLELGNYLPLSFKTPSEQEYIAFLWDAFESNYTNGKYQFAFLAYHMLTMSFVYFKIWQIKQTQRKDFEKSMIGFNRNVERELLDATSPFTFGQVNESSVLRFFKLIGFDNDKISNYTALVKARNETAHANGNIFLSTQRAIDNKIATVLRLTDEIQIHSKPIIEKGYGEFLLQNYDSEEREYPDTTDQIREVLVHGSYMSQKDIDICLGIDVSLMKTHACFSQIEELHQALRDKYSDADPSSTVT